MKKIFTLLFILLYISAHAQYYPNFSNTLTFESSDTLCHRDIIMDTMHVNNLWQIGQPHKTVFTSLGGQHVLVTDTANTYPINDTSIFYLKMELGHSSDYPTHWRDFMSFSFSYRLDIDTGEIARVEISIDTGKNWVNIFADSLPANLRLVDTDKHALSYSTMGWRTLELEPISLREDTDTILFRFTFISDSVDTHKDGWEIDDISVNYYAEGVPQITRNNNLINIYPNPSVGNFCIRSQQPFPHSATVAIYNTLGQEVYQTSNIPVNGIFDLPLPNGMYVLKYTTDKEYAVKQLIITR